MNIVFRVDASAMAGTGHVMRCLTLAKKLEEKKDRICIIFICRAHAGHLADFINSNGFTVYLLPESSGNFISGSYPRHASWLGDSQEQDAEQTSVILRKQVEGKVDWLIVDHYGIEALWHGKLRCLARKIMVIDDLADRHLNCDLLLDQNLWDNAALRYKGFISKKCTSLFGPGYALLRDEFRLAVQHLKRYSGRIKNITAFFGGADVSGECAKLLAAWEQVSPTGMKLRLITGLSNGQHDYLSDKYRDKVNIEINQFIPQVAGLLLKTDYFIGASGASNWERFCLGVHSSVVASAFNQIAQAEYLAANDFVHYLGIGAALSINSYVDFLSSFMNNKEVDIPDKKLMSIVDGNGCVRVSALILEQQI